MRWMWRTEEDSRKKESEWGKKERKKEKRVAYARTFHCSQEEKTLVEKEEGGGDMNSFRKA